MIKTVKRNWPNIQQAMLRSQQTEYCWIEYARKISNGLSNAAVLKDGCGDIIWFVEHLNEYANVSNEYLRFAKKFDDQLIEFIDSNREFLQQIK